jgi:hypothetical protein
MGPGKQGDKDWENNLLCLAHYIMKRWLICTVDHFWLLIRLDFDKNSVFM